MAKDNIPLISRNIFLYEFQKDKYKELRRRWLDMHGNVDEKIIAEQMSPFLSWVKNFSFKIPGEPYYFDKRIIPSNDRFTEIHYMYNHRLGAELEELIILFSNAPKETKVITDKLLKLKYEELSLKEFQHRIGYYTEFVTHN